MDNLVIKASSWLQDSACKTGSVQDRTQSVLRMFKDYLRVNKDELQAVTGKDIKELINEVVACQNVFSQIIVAYLRGVHYIAIHTAKSFISGLDPISLPIGARLYKARESSSNYLFAKDDMFHIPYDKRSKIGNQRYSVSGMPCLYLASSSYVCWEELGRVDFQSCNFCGYTNKVEIPFYDFALPLSIDRVSDIKRVCIILACSLSAIRESLFKEEYILPQSLLQALILKHHYFHLDRRVFGIRYLSVHALNGGADCFNIDLGEEKWINRLYNFVFPAASAEMKGYNSLLQDLFVQTDTIAMFKEILRTPDKLIGGVSDDVYLDSQFGLMDAFLDEKMGYKPLRQEATILTV